MGTGPQGSSKLRQAVCVVASLAAASALLATILGAEMDVATARTGSGDSVVNRALKGDRLPLIPSFGTRSRANEPLLPEGCVANFKAAPSAFWVEVPGRCVSELPVPSPAVG